MTTYDDRFGDIRPDGQVFAKKGALDPLAEPAEIIVRRPRAQPGDAPQRVHDGYLPTTASIDGPPGTGKTITTRRVCRKFATKTDQVAAEYVTETNLISV